MPGMPASPFKMIKPLAGRALEVALNRALARLDIDDATGPTAPSARHLMFAASGMGAF